VYRRLQQYIRRVGSLRADERRANKARQHDGRDASTGLSLLHGRFLLRSCDHSRRRMSAVDEEDVKIV